MQIIEDWQIALISTAFGFFLFILWDRYKERKSRTKMIDLLIAELILFDVYLSKALDIGVLNPDTDSITITSNEMHRHFPLDIEYYGDISAESLSRLMNPAIMLELRRTYEMIEFFNSRQKSIGGRFILYGVPDLQMQIQATIQMLDREKSLFRR